MTSMKQCCVHTIKPEPAMLTPNLSYSIKFSLTELCSGPRSRNRQKECSTLHLNNAKAQERTSMELPVTSETQVLAEPTCGTKRSEPITTTTLNGLDTATSQRWSGRTPRRLAAVRLEATWRAATSHKETWMCSHQTVWETTLSPSNELRTHLSENPSMNSTTSMSQL